MNNGHSLAKHKPPPFASCGVQNFTALIRGKVLRFMSTPFTRILTLLFVFAALVQTSISWASNDIPAVDRQRSCEPVVAIAAAEEILNDQEILFEPLSMVSPSLILFLNGRKDEAVFWFYAAQLRTRYQLVFENGDRGQLLAIMMMTTGALINNYAFQNLDHWSEIMDKVIEWDRNTYNPHRKIKHTAQNDKDIEKIYTGFTDLKQKVLSEKSEYEKKARLAAPEIERAYSNYKCDKNPQPSANTPAAIKPGVKQFFVILGVVSEYWQYRDLKPLLHKTVDDEEQFAPMLKKAAYLGTTKSCSKTIIEDSDTPIRGAVKFSAVCKFANGSAKVTALIRQGKGSSEYSQTLYEFDIVPLYDEGRQGSIVYDSVTLNGGAPYGDARA